MFALPGHAEEWGCYDPQPGHPTEAEKKRFISEISPLAVMAERTHGVPAAVISAMAIAESGYGWTRTALEAHNLFGWKFYSSSSASGRNYYVLSCQPAEDKNNKYVKFSDTADAIDFVAGKLATLPAYLSDTRKYLQARQSGKSVADASKDWINADRKAA
ncbi:glucosaminidase domain-containing protein [Pseudomonas kribbensis]|uniref:glucosaminidase domain-containing protein n=1 Tax=Pseudomonas kribbensis TaxID=1628086 RepID=UPI003D77750E